MQEEGAAANERSLDCLEERGFVVTRFHGGESSIEIPPGPDGERQLLDAWEECDAAAGYPEVVPFSDKELSKMYDLALERAECLRTNGWDPVEPPSRTLFIEHYQLLQAGASEEPPYDPASRYAPAEQNAILEVCPQLGLGD